MILPQVRSEGEARFMLMLWELSHCAMTLELRELSRHNLTKLVTVGIKPPPKDTCIGDTLVVDDMHVMQYEDFECSECIMDRYQM